MSFTRSICLTVLALLSASLGHAQGLEQYRQEMVSSYIPQVRSEYQSMLPDVEQNVEDWVADTDDGTWAYGNPLVDILVDIETDWLKEVQTGSCNFADSAGGFTTHLHTYDDVHTMWKITTNQGNLPIGYLCDINIFFEYDPDDTGIEAGECLNIIYIPIINIFICIWSHVVDYYFPTMKVNFSNQLFYSRYLPLQEVLQYYIQFKITMEVIRALYITQTMWEVYKFMGVPPWLWQVWIEGPDELADDPTNAFMRGNLRETGRSMMMGEEEIQDDAKWYAPIHREKEQPFFATDFNSQDMLWWLHENEDRNEDMYEGFLDGANEPCVKNNTASGKTPQLPGLWAGEYQPSGDGEGDIDNMPCFKNVGETAIFNKHRRPHTSDGFWQSIIKGMRDYFIEYDRGDRYTFEQDIERIHYLPEFLSIDQLQRNDAFAESIDKGTHGVFNCPLINRDSEGDDMVNRDYFEANIVEDRKAREETTAEVFTAFSGCWSPLPQWAWMIIFRWLPSVHGQFYNTRTE